MTKKLLSMWIVVAILFTGCSFFHKKIADENHPKKYFSQYETLTAVYGTGKTDTLTALGISPNDVIFDSDNNNRLIIPFTEIYSNVEFNILLLYNFSKLYRVNNIKTYRYPDELDQAIADVMKIAKQMEKDLGKPHEVDGWNDWYEEEYDIEMDQKTPAYKDAEQIKAFLEAGLGGGIMSWDMTAVACDAVKTELEERNTKSDFEYKHNVVLWIDRSEDAINLQINY